MEKETYLSLKEQVRELGYGADIEWAENVKRCDNIEDFILEYIFVVCNSGMKSQIARVIFDKIILAVRCRVPVWDVFKNFPKVNAINHMLGLKNHYFSEYLKAEDVLEFCATLPYMGKTIKYHFAKNLGYDCIKPDRHLIRIAKIYQIDPFSMCQKLSDETGDSLNVVDTSIWRAANLGLI